MRKKNTPPRLVLCLGLKSSGSTWLYNAVIGMLKAAERGRVAAFYADNLGMIPKDAGSARFLVVKCHEPSAGLLLLARLLRGTVLLSVREPRDAAASLMQRFRHPFAAVLRDIGREAAQILTLEEKPLLTLRYEDRFFEREETLTVIARALGLRLRVSDRRRIFRALSREATAKRIDRLVARGSLANDPDAFDPATHLHPGHLGDGRVGKFREVLTAQEQKQIAAATRAYSRRFGYGRPRKR
ncbi:MAG: hypothetical protein JO261_16190 [Alphaproteobacteria bacterium]|nr:hypothetical protein [Alphaproteobacteria bacterium]MBV9695232.1 hypothetical protein [Alphaproteobacteria bacterium]